MKHPIPTVFLALGLFLAAGCSSRVNFPEWQAEVERFVIVEGNGDLNVLRDDESPSGRRVFAVHGSEDPKTSTDTVGLLLGHAVLADSPSYIFLVGTVAKGVPEEVRVVTLSRNDRAFLWRVGPSDGKALNAYRRAQPESPSRLIPRLGWPHKEDVFDLQTTPTTATVTEKLSGAQWKLVAAGKTLK